jgi:hypothetical protein
MLFYYIYMWAQGQLSCLWLISQVVVTRNIMSIMN